MNCVIFGAGGFIGRHLGGSLAAAGHDVTGFDVRAGDAAGFTIEACDVRLAAPVAAGADAVFYLAQWPSYRAFPAHAGDLFAVNLTGALRAAEAAAQAGAQFFCYASTGTVYRGGFAPLDEDAPLSRGQGYALSKLAAEEALRAMGLDMPLLCARLFGVFGPRQTGMLVPAIADRVRQGKPVVIERHPDDPGDLDGLRLSLTFIDDLVACLSRLAERSRAGTAMPDVLNVAGDRAVSIRALAMAIGDALGIEPAFEVSDEPRPMDFIADIGRLRALADPTFTPLAEAIARTVGAGVATGIAPGARPADAGRP